MSGVADLNEAREARRMSELLNRFDEALKAEGIEPDSTLGAAFVILRAGLEWGDTDRREHRAWLVKFAVEFEERQLRLIEDAQAVADTYKSASEDERVTRDKIARKAQADLERAKLAMQDSILKTLEQVTPKIVEGVRQASVIRVKAFNRALYARHLAAGVALVLAVLGLTFEFGRFSRSLPSPVETSSESGSGQ